MAINSIKIIQYKVNYNFFLKDTFPYNNFDEFLCYITNINCGLFFIFYRIYLVLQNFLSVFLVFIFDGILLYKIRNYNKRRLNLLNSKGNSINQKVAIENEESERRIKSMLVANGIIFLIIRLPEIILAFLYISNSEFLKCQYEVCLEYVEYFDFLFQLNGFCQFLLFYLFNKNFNESFKDRFLKSEIKKESIKIILI